MDKKTKPKVSKGSGTKKEHWPARGQHVECLFGSDHALYLSGHSHFPRRWRRRGGEYCTVASHVTTHFLLHLMLFHPVPSNNIVEACKHPHRDFETELVADSGAMASRGCLLLTPTVHLHRRRITMPPPRPNPVRPQNGSQCYLAH